MSGTSLDGIDIAICSFSELDSNPNSFQFIAAKTFPFPYKLRKKLQNLILNPQISLQELGDIDVELGRLIAHSINQFLTSKNLTVQDIVAIGSHGQTLFHSPDTRHPFSFQIGNANEIAELTGITTIADFRQRDIAAGGQGAPLVPAFHQSVFCDYNKDRVIVNIGGISNITVLPSSEKEKVLGFDTGPGNGLLDYWIQSQLGESYDKSGQWAASGICNNAFLSLLLDTAYFKQTIPKSTGRELFNKSWLNGKLAQLEQDIPAADVQATLVELTAITISNDIKTYANASQGIFICGGGAHNHALLKRLKSLLSDKKITTTQALNLDPDWVEACAFAWLAYRTTHQKTGNLASVTGANRAVILGAIYPA